MAERLIKEALNTLEEPIFSTKNQELALACLRVLNDRKFSLSAERKFFVISLAFNRDVSNILNAENKDEKWEDSFYNYFGALRENIHLARTKCQAIADHFLFTEEDTNLEIRNRVDVEETARSKYSR